MDKQPDSSTYNLAPLDILSPDLELDEKEHKTLQASPEAPQLDTQLLKDLLGEPISPEK